MPRGCFNFGALGANAPKHHGFLWLVDSDVVTLEHLAAARVSKLKD